MKLISMLVIMVTCIFSQIDKHKFQHSKNVVQGDIFEANNVKALVANNGWLFWGGGPSGFIVPSPTFSNNDGNFATVFASGIWLSGVVNGVVRTSMAYYGSDYTPGLWDEFNADPTGVGNRENDKYTMYYYYSQNHLNYLQSLLDAPDPTANQKIHSFASGELDRAATANQDWAAVAVIEQGAPATPPGDLVAFAVYHDSFLDVRSTARGANDPLKIQVRMMVWAYNRTGSIDNSVFVKMEFINKNTVPIDSVYAGIWSDPDVGQFADDLVGSDAVLGLAYAYNGAASDAQYTAVLGLAPPAVGYDYFQGPIIDSPGYNIVKRSGDLDVYINQDANYIFYPTDVIIPNKYVRPASGMYYYNNGDEPVAPIGWHNFNRGLSESGAENPIKLAAISGALTSVQDASFFFNGDPAANTGWLDANPDDRRFVITNGPFIMGVSNGSQVYGDPGYNSITFAVYTSFGSSNLNSVSKLKLDNFEIAKTYTNAFVLDPEIPAPQVSSAGLFETIELYWEPSDFNYTYFGESRSVSSENYVLSNYNFQGYQLVQFDQNEDFKTISYFDIIDTIMTVYQGLYDQDGYIVVLPLIKASNSGISHSFTINKDYFDNQPLIDNEDYNYGVRSYAVNLNPLDGLTRIRFSEWARVENIKLNRQDSLSYPTTVGTLLPFNLDVGSGDGKVSARVVDPTQTSSDAYKITVTTLASNSFHPGYPGDTIPAGTLVWNLLKNNVLVVGDMPLLESNQTELRHGYSTILDGIEWQLLGPSDDFKNFLMTQNANGPINPPDYAAFAFNGSGFPHPTTGDRPDGAVQQSNGSTWGIHTGGNGSRQSYASFVSRSVTERNGWGKLIPDDFEVRFTVGPNYAWENFGDGRVNAVPMEVWNISKGFRAIIAHTDNNGDRIFNFDGTDHEISGGTNDPQTDWYYWYEPVSDLSAGQSGYDAWVAASGGEGGIGAAVGEEIIGRQVLVNWNGGTVPGGPFNALMPEVGSIIQYQTNKPITDGNEFSIAGVGGATSTPKYFYTGTFTIAGSGTPVRDIELDARVNDGIGLEKNSRTDDLGNYTLDFLRDRDYRIRVNLNSPADSRIGVTALDLALIQRHILGLETLNSPYKLLSADANLSGVITASDLTKIQNVILGKDSNFELINGDTVPINFLGTRSDFIFTDALNPFSEWQTSINYDSVRIDSNRTINFAMAKIGDVNQSFGQTSKQKSIPLVFNFAMNESVDFFELILTVESFKQISSYQFGLEWNPDALEFLAIQPGSKSKLKLDQTHVNSDLGKLTTLWFDSKTLDINDGNELVRFRFRNKSNSAEKNILFDESMADASQNFESIAITSNLGNAGIDMIPKQFELSRNYPNPFNPVTTIRFGVPRQAEANIRIYNLLGQLVRTHVKSYSAGFHTFTWNGRDDQNRSVSSGIYFYQFQSEEFSKTYKMMLIK